eukprot:5739108-Pleurochrysis_carterae.AAC.1
MGRGREECRGECVPGKRGGWTPTCVDGRHESGSRPSSCPPPRQWGSIGSTRPIGPKASKRTVSGLSLKTARLEASGACRGMVADCS